MYPYQNYGYQPNYQQPNYMQRQYAPQPPQMPQNQQQAFSPMQTPPPMETPIQDIKFVNRAQAEAYIVFPNTKVMLIDTENGMVHIKTADNMGQTKTDYFRFEQVNPDGSPIKAQEPIPQVNYDEFVKVEQLKEFGFVTIEQYNALAQKLDQMQKKLEGVKLNGTATKPETRVQL
jgi:hypothetical protein